MKTFVRFFIFVGAVLVPLSAVAQESIVRLGGLSPQRAFAGSAEGKAGMARLAALEEKHTREIAAKNKALQSREQALQETGAVLSEQARTQQTRELEKFRVDVQRFIQEAQADLLGAQRDIESAFVVRLRPVVEQVAKARGLQLVVNLDTDAVVWADSAVDITGEVVKQLARPDAPGDPIIAAGPSAVRPDRGVRTAAL
jgi:Skp family chaperone for outer membrane proteins